MAGWEREQAKKRQADAGKANLPGARESGSIDANSEKGRVDQILANKAGVGEATVRRAIAVREHGTEALNAKVAAGAITVNEAEKIAKLKPAPKPLAIARAVSIARSVCEDANPVSCM